MSWLYSVRRWVPAYFTTVLLIVHAAGCRDSHELRPAPSPVSYAPDVPPADDDRSPKKILVDLSTRVHDIGLDQGVMYHAWTFNDRVPGPFIRARVNDTVEISISNADTMGLEHNVDFHAASGPGGGADITNVKPGQRRVADLTMLHPGLFVYHCAANPVWDHIANGMYGLILVEPSKGLPGVDREFSVMQGEFYTTAPVKDSVFVGYDPVSGLHEDPRYVVFNGSAQSLLGKNALQVRTDQTVRIYFGNAGPNKVASFHVIGAVFDNVYRDGDLVSPPAHDIQTTLVPPGGSTVVEFRCLVPGTYTLVDHAVFRLPKGAMGHI